MSARGLRIGLPILLLALVVIGWDLVVRAFAIPPYVLPGPGLVAATLLADAGLLWQSLLVTLTITFEGFLLAVFGGIALAIAFNQWRLVEYSL
ncbi:MAG TPA: ABC transporter permease, partial [Pseudolabrys sp.]